MKGILKINGKFILINVTIMTEDLLCLYPSAEVNSIMFDWNNRCDKEITEEEACLLSDFSDPKEWTTDTQIYLVDDSKKDIVQQITDREELYIIREKAEEAAYNKAIQDKKDEAIRTGKPVLLKQTSVPEEFTPLRNDKEDDMVTCSLFAMPDGTTKWKYSHNY